MKTFNDKEYSRILAYIQDELPPQEKEEISELLRQDPDWYNEVEEVKDLTEIAKDAYYEDKVRNLLASAENIEAEEALNYEGKILDLMVDPKANPWKRPLQWLAAASFIGVLSVFVYQQYDSGQKQKLARLERVRQEQELARLREQQRNRVTIEARDMAQSLINDSIALGTIPPKLGNSYTGLSSEDTRQKAIRQLEAMGKTPQSTPTDPDKRLYGSGENTPAKPKLTSKEESYRGLLLGIGYVKEGNNKAAVEQLNQIKDSSLAQDVSWYKALAYLQLGKNKEARAELVKITDNRYLKNANELLAALPQ